jgi:hypothetical protein
MRRRPPSRRESETLPSFSVPDDSRVDQRGLARCVLGPGDSTAKHVSARKYDDVEPLARAHISAVINSPMSEITIAILAEH